MQGVAKTGRTVLFVSHNMAAVENLCQRAIVLQEGRIVFDGATKDGIDRYYQSVSGEQVNCTSARVDLTTHSGRPPIYRPILTSLEFFNGDGKPLNGGLKVGGSLKATIGFRLEQPVLNMEAALGFQTLSGQHIFTAHTTFEPNRSATECLREGTFICEIPNLTLVAGVYKVLVALEMRDAVADIVEDAARIEVLKSDFYGTGKSPWDGFIVLKHHWYLE